MCGTVVNRNVMTNTRKFSPKSSVENFILFKRLTFLKTDGRASWKDLASLSYSGPRCGHEGKIAGSRDKNDKGGNAV